MNSKSSLYLVQAVLLYHFGMRLVMIFAKNRETAQKRLLICQIILDVSVRKLIQVRK